MVQVLKKNRKKIKQIIGMFSGMKLEALKYFQDNLIFLARIILMDEKTLAEQAAMLQRMQFGKIRPFASANAAFQALLVNSNTMLIDKIEFLINRHDFSQIAFDANPQLLSDLYALDDLTADLVMLAFTRASIHCVAQDNYSLAQQFNKKALALGSLVSPKNRSIADNWTKALSLFIEAKEEWQKRHNARIAVEKLKQARKLCTGRANRQILLEKINVLFNMILAEQKPETILDAKDKVLSIPLDLLYQHVLDREFEALFLLCRSDACFLSFAKSVIQGINDLKQGKYSSASSQLERAVQSLASEDKFSLLDTDKAENLHYILSGWLNVARSAELLTSSQIEESYFIINALINNGFSHLNLKSKLWKYDPSQKGSDKILQARLRHNVSILAEIIDEILIYLEAA